MLKKVEIQEEDVTEMSDWIQQFKNEEDTQLLTIENLRTFNKKSDEF